jgi:hypothetical protein
MQSVDEATEEEYELATSIFDITKWPVFTPDARRAIKDIFDTHYILPPPIYDHPGQLVEPLDYPRRFRGCIALVQFNISCFKLPWTDKNTICADLTHLRILVTPNPATPVTPRHKRSRVLRYDPLFTLTGQPDFKKAKLEAEKEGSQLLSISLVGPN